MTNRVEVADFLRSFKLAIEFGCCHFIGRPRTDQDLADLNLTRKLAMDTVCTLTPDNYCSGPVPDDTDAKKMVWVFGCDVDGVEVYVKLRLNPTGGNGISRGSIWSFHKAQYPMRYPLRGRGA